MADSRRNSLFPHPFREQPDAEGRQPFDHGPSVVPGRTRRRARRLPGSSVPPVCRDISARRRPGPRDSQPAVHPVAQSRFAGRGLPETGNAPRPPRQAAGRAAPARGPEALRHPRELPPVRPRPGAEDRARPTSMPWSKSSATSTSRRPRPRESWSAPRSDPTCRDFVIDADLFKQACST